MPVGPPMLLPQGLPPHATAATWQPGDPAPLGYNIRYKRDSAMIIGGGATLALSYTVTTLISSGIAGSGFPGLIYAPLGSIPVVGVVPVAMLGALSGVGPGTIGALVALGVTQAVGLGVMVRGIVAKKPIGLVPLCPGVEQADLRIAPLASPQMGGLSISGSL